MSKTTTIKSCGRLCLFGEHSDWAADYGKNNGYCIVVGSEQGLTMAASRAPGKLSIAFKDKYISLDWNAESLSKVAKDQSNFFCYCVGTAYQFINTKAGGLDVVIESMDLPLKKGVSSSAAVCTAIARAFSEVYNLNLFPHEIMDIAYRGERMTGSECGRMDQACIYGNTPVLLTFEKSRDIRVEPIFPLAPLYLFFVDLAGQKDTIKILKDLNSAYLQNNGVDKALGEINEKNLRSAYTLMTEGNAEGLGKLMITAQEDFDQYIMPYCTELLSPKLHKLLKLDKLKPYVYGGKGVGSQGDGVAQFVAKGEKERDEAIKIIGQVFPEMTCFPLTISAQK